MGGRRRVDLRRQEPAGRRTVRSEKWSRGTLSGGRLRHQSRASHSCMLAPVSGLLHVEREAPVEALVVVKGESTRVFVLPVTVKRRRL